MRDSVDCPTCQTEQTIGLPRDATVEAVAANPTVAPEDLPTTTRIARPECEGCGSIAVVYSVDESDRSDEFVPFY